MDPGFDFIDGSETKPSLLCEYGSVVRFTHCFHDLFLSASFKSGGIVIHGISELSFILSGSSKQFLFGLSSVVFGGLFAEEVVTMEDPIGVDGNGSHPDGSDPSQPPLVSFENEVSIVEHFPFINIFPKLNC